MPVLIEGVCVLLKKGSLIERYQGGYGQFLFDLYDRSKMSESDELVSISFDTHEQARGYLQFLVQRGLKIMLLNEDNPNNTDAMLVDQVFGPSFRVYWLDFIHLSPNPHYKIRKNQKTSKPKNKVGNHEDIVIAATEKEMDDKEEQRLLAWGKDEISFPKDWEFKTSKSMDLEFMRMAENRSKLTH